MTLAEFLAAITTRLSTARIPYMITGSLASSFHGEPRATRDVDLVIDPTRAGLRKLVEGLERDEYYVDMAAALEALDRRTQFNVIHPHSGWKVDLILRKERPFSRSEFDRRQKTELLGAEAYVATAEDTIIAKLEWASAGDSERQLRDAIAIAALVGDQLDDRYVERWIEALGLGDLWRRVRDASRPADAPP